MHTRLLVIIALCLLFAAAAPFATAQKVSLAQAKEDLQYACTAYSRLHPGVNRYSSAQHLQHVTDSILNQWQAAPPTDSLMVYELYYAVNTLLADIACVHSNVYLPEGIYKRMGTSAPLALQNDTLFLGKTSQPENAVTHLNAEPASQVITRLLNLHVGDGHTRIFDRHTAALVVKYSLRQVCYAQDSLNLQLASGRDTTITFDKELKPGTNSNKKKPLTLTYSQAEDTAYMVIPNYNGPVKKRHIRRAFKQLHQQPAPHLVIDLRNNTGGKFNRAVLTSRYLADSTTRVRVSIPRGLATRQYYGFGTTFMPHYTMFWSQIVKGNLPYVNRNEVGYKTAKRPKRSHHYNGQVTLLTNAWTLSSGSMAAAFIMRYRPGTTHVGTVGGGITGSQGATMRKVILPHSKIKMNIPLARLNHF